MLLFFMISNFRKIGSRKLVKISVLSFFIVFIFWGCFANFISFGGRGEFRRFLFSPRKTVDFLISYDIDGNLKRFSAAGFIYEKIIKSGRYLMGYGPGSIGFVYPSKYSGRYLKEYSFLGGATPQFAKILFEQGFVGMFLYLFMFSNITRLIFRFKKDFGRYSFYNQKKMSGLDTMLLLMPVAIFLFFTQGIITESTWNLEVISFFFWCSYFITLKEALNRKEELTASAATVTRISVSEN